MSRWRWLLRRRSDHKVPLSPGHDESILRADRCLAEVRRQRPRVQELEDVLERRKRANSFTEVVRHAFGGD